MIKIYKDLNEEDRKQKFVSKIFSLLNWDIHNPKEVSHEQKVEELRVDYSLKEKNKDKVFIEAKRVSEDLKKHQEQLLNYSFIKGIKLAILTNGIQWEFYLPLKEGNWRERKFHNINLKDDETENIVDNFNKLLSKENVFNGSAVKYGEELHENNLKRRLINENISNIININS
jgi:predicted type IV restriction endonuclease